MGAFRNDRVRRAPASDRRERGRVMFVLIIPILIAVVVIVSVRRRADAGTHAPSPAVTAELVERWRGAALISPDQAAAITEYERTHAPLPATPASHGPVVAEILGYVGAVLAAIGIGIVVARVDLSLQAGAILAQIGRAHV